MRSIICTVLSLATTPLMAEPPAIPRFDSEGYCRQIERRTGLDGNSIVPSCLASEQESLEALRGLWPQVPDQIRITCEQRVRATTTGSYAALQGCVDMEEEAAANLGRRSGARP